MIDIIKSEIYHLKQEYSFMKKVKFDSRKIMDKVELWVNKGYSLTKIKKLIRELLRDLYFFINVEIKKLVELQLENIGANPKLPHKPFENLNLKELLDGRTNSHFRSLLSDDDKEKKQRRNVRAITGLTDTYTKQQRENGYNSIKPDEPVKGWLSKAILDGRTSFVCAKLHNRYFPIPDRSKVPNPPPRHPNCYDKNTEVLTEDGFKFIKDVEVGEKCFSYNPYGNGCEYVKVIKTFKGFEDKIYTIKSKTVNMAISTNHKIIGYTRHWRDRKKYIFKEYDNLLDTPSDLRLCVGLDWKSKKQDTILINKKVFDSKAFMRFLGIYLSDGHYCKKSKNVIISNSRKQDIILKMLEGLELPIKVWKEKLAINSPELHKYCSKLGNNFREKFIPKNIKNMSKSNLKEFILGYLESDGHTSPNKDFKGYISKGSKALFTSNPRLRDDLMEVALKSGYSVSTYTQKPKCSIKKNGEIIKSNFDCYVIYLLSNKYRSLDYCKKELIKYDDYVYDIELEKYHTLLTKNDGKIVWGSNCRSSLLPIYDLAEIKDKQGENLKSWLKDNPKEGKDLLGIEKYKLVMDNKLRIDSFMDLKNGKYYTNEEIKDRLK